MAYYIGVDGGGTKTALCAIDAEGRVIGETAYEYQQQKARALG